MYMMDTTSCVLRWYHHRCWARVSGPSSIGIEHRQPGGSLDIPKFSQGDKNQPGALLDYFGGGAFRLHPGDGKLLPRGRAAIVFISWRSCLCVLYAFLIVSIVQPPAPPFLCVSR